MQRKSNLLTVVNKNRLYILYIYYSNKYREEAHQGLTSRWAIIYTLGI